MQTRTSGFIQSIKSSISERLCSGARQQNDRLRAKVERQERDLVALNERLMRRSDPPQPVMNAPLAGRELDKSKWACIITTGGKA